MTDAASPRVTIVPSDAAGRRWSGLAWSTAGHDAPAGPLADRHDAKLGPARGIAIAVLLALPVWGVLAVTVRWLLVS